MIVKLADCEKRNLDVVSYEITVEDGESYADFCKILRDVPDDEYLVVKTPSNDKEFLWGMQEQDFTFIEAQMLLQMKPKDLRKLPHFDQYMSDVSVKIAATDDARQRIYDNVADGLFTTDRITLDKYFTLADASRRYRNWVQDAYEGGADLAEMFYQGKPAGFFIAFHVQDKAGSMGLTSIYKDSAGKGLGGLVLYKEAERLIEHGAEVINTGISSNNYRSVRTHLALGFGVSRVLNVYVKHGKEIKHD